MPPSGPAAHHNSSDLRRLAAGKNGHLHIEPTPIYFRIFTRPQQPDSTPLSEVQDPNEADVLMKSRNAFLVWESESSSPKVAFPRSDVRFADDEGSDGIGLRLCRQTPEKPPSKLGSQFFDLYLDNNAKDKAFSTAAAWTFARTTPLTESTSKDAPAPDDLIVLQGDKFPQVWEEDSIEIGSVRNPYHRVDLVPSNRHVQVFAIGKDRKTEYLVADTERVKGPRRVKALFETGYPTRWYLPALAVQAGIEKGVKITPEIGANPSRYPADGHRTVCPYKGFAQYHRITLPDGDVLDNAAWAYPDPIPALDARELIAFWAPGNDRLRLVVDGEEITK